MRAHPANADGPAVFASLRGYRGTWLRGDVLAGLTVWAVLVPEALAYATIAGVSPVVGLYAPRPDFIAAVAAMPGVLVFDTLPGLFIGIACSLLLLVYRASRPHVAVLARVSGTRDHFVDVARHPKDEPPPGVVILRVESGLFFANTDHVRGAIRAHVAPGVKGIVLDAETMPFIDVTAARMLGELAVDLRREGVRLAIARDVGQVRDVLRGAGGAAAVVTRYRTVHEAVQALSEEPALPRRV